jgi:hypothetical protein
MKVLAPNIWLVDESSCTILMETQILLKKINFSFQTYTNSELLPHLFKALAEIATRGTRHSRDFCPNGYLLGWKSLEVDAQAWCPLSLFLLVRWYCLMSSWPDGCSVKYPLGDLYTSDQEPWPGQFMHCDWKKRADRSNATLY